MKQTLFFLLITLTQFCAYAQIQPDWVSQRPVNTLFYIGIGRGWKSDKDYQQQAKQNALNDLISEIRVEVSAHSLLYQLDDGSEVKSVFQENIRLQAKQDIEKFQLVDSWQNEQEYWVYYQLNRFDYEDYMEKRRHQAIRQGYDYLSKGRLSLQHGDLILAAEMFIKGLEVIRPCIHEELTCDTEKGKIDVGNELYASVKNVFSGIAIVPSVKILAAKAFQGIENPVILTVTRNGFPLRNLPLQYSFKSGAGRLSGDPVTDERGRARLYIRNINSKLSRQDLCITVDRTPFGTGKKDAYANLFKPLWQTLPIATVQLQLEKTPVNAWMHIRSGNNEAVEKAIRSLLVNHYFNLVTDPAAADITVTMGSDFKKGGKITGEVYDLTEYFSGVHIEIVNNRHQTELLNYVIDDLKTAVPESTSEPNAKASATRELLKRLNRELAIALKNLEIDTQGDIPVPPVQKEMPKANPLEKIPGEPSVSPHPLRDSSQVKGEFEPGIMICYIGKKILSDRSILEFKVINTTSKDYELNLYVNAQKAIDEKGEELKIVKMKLGSSESSWKVKATILPEVNTALFLYLPRVDKIKLVQFINNQGMVKLRNIE